MSLKEAENEWRVIPDHPWYEINLLGDVRYSDTKWPLKPVVTIQGKYYHLLQAATVFILSASALIESTFPELVEA
jgi:hypothetical protein